MSRLARVVVPGIPHHIIQRGNRRQNTFFKRTDYLEYIQLMSEWCGKCDVEIWAYCLMSNHVHMIAVPDDTRGMVIGIGEAHRRYTRMINFRKSWRGHLWQGRFLSYPMDEKYLLTAVRYIERNPGLSINREWGFGGEAPESDRRGQQNASAFASGGPAVPPKAPLKAGICKSPEEYEWSSAKAHRNEKDDKLVKVRPLLDRVESWSEYINIMDDRKEESEIKRNECTGRPLGSEEFVKKIENELGRKLSRQKPGPKGNK